MKKLYLFCWLCLPASAILAQPVAEKLDELLVAYARQNQFNGAALVAQKGKILLEKGYGWKNIQDSAKNDEQTIFQVGSVTKQFTSAIILQLQQQNKLSVQDKLNKYYPDFPNGGMITIEHLLTHTSGIYNYTNDMAFMKTGSLKPNTHDAMIALFKSKPLDFTPGSKYSYSNSGYLLLGYIIEKVTGKSYFQVVRERIFQPLHMDHSGFDFAGLKSKDKATGYFVLTGSNAEPATIVDSTASSAAGAIYTTVGDLYKWDRALYTTSILTGSSLQQAFTPHKGNYGYGWVIDSTGGKKVVEHGGGIFGFSSIITRNITDDICIILIDNHQSPILNKIADGLTDILNNKSPEVPRAWKEINVDTAILRQYVGEYELVPNFILAITLENGQLMIQATGQGKAPLYAEKENFFFLKVVDAQVEFIKGTDGKTDKLLLHQNGQVMPANKIK